MIDEQVHIFEDSRGMLDALADRVMGILQTADRPFHLALSGGSTPAGLYRLLAQRSAAGLTDWRSVHIWFGDERCVPPEHPDSNFRMARQTLLDPIQISTENIHRIQGEDTDPRRAAAAYAKELKALAPKVDDWPVLDLMLLGIGADGHVASLFPGSANLAAREVTVSAARVSEHLGWRISLTLPVIRAARRLIIIASGASKAVILARVLASSPMAEDRELPSVLVRDLPQLEWYLDAKAAARL